jgi:pre-mRNA-processing factor 6
MWLALAKLEVYDKAKQIINKARKAIPHEITIWIHAAKLEEAQNPDTCDKQVDELIERSVRALLKYDVEVPLQKWVEEAQICEISGSIKVCSAILKTAIKEDLTKNKEKNDEYSLEKKNFWIEIADGIKEKGCIHMTKEIYLILLNYFKNSFDIWIKLIELEKKYGTKEEQTYIMKKSVEDCADNHIFWVIYSDYKLKNESIFSAKEILKEALNIHKNNQEIILIIEKYEKMEGNFSVAQEMLKTARENIDSSTNKIWIESIQLERQLGNNEKALHFCEMAMKKFSDFPKFFMIGGQIKEALGDNYSAGKIYERGIEINKKNPFLYICLAKLHYDNPGISRSVFEKALKALPNDERIFYEFVKFENYISQSNNQKLFNKRLNNIDDIYEENEEENNLNLKNNSILVLNKALKECPNSGLLWSLAIDLEMINKHGRAAEALKKCETSVHIKTAVGKLFAKEKNIEKARTWFDNAIRSNPEFGDAWIYYYKLEKQFGDEVIKIKLLFYKSKIL